MGKTTKTISFSLLPDIVDRLDEAAGKEGRPRSEILRDAVVRYLEYSDLEELFRYGEQQAKRMGIKPEDVNRLVEEYRTEVDSDSV